MNSPYPDISRLADLQQLIADFASIDRMLNLANKDRPENDADHSFGLALTAWFLADKIAPNLDQQKILKYALAHDLVELYAGDTFSFGTEEDLATKHEREQAALKRLAREWPDFPELIKYIKDYEDRADEEAKFVYALDKILPIILVNLGEKHAYWRKHKVTRERFIEAKKKILASKYIAPYFEAILNWMEEGDYYHKID